LKKYNQFQGLVALTKASILAMLKSPSAIFFSIAFPLIFIIAFGLMSDGQTKISIAINSKSDTLNPIYKTISSMPTFDLSKKSDIENIELLKKGKIAGIVSINKIASSSHFVINFQSSNAAGNEQNIAKQILNSTIDNINKIQFPENKSIAKINVLGNLEGRPFKYLDFFLPGMLGFSILSAGIFGTAFVFFNLRQTLVLKRFFATPIKRINIIFAEGFSRLILQLLAASIIILVGHFAFNYTLIHGFATFFQMLVMCFIGLIVFLGMGFLISSLAKNETMIPPISNMITMPQLILSGVFLGVNNFPEWLQPFCKILPLTQLNDALREIAFQGKTLFDCWQQIGILSLWGILVYILVIKFFRWE
jgi:ABC-2 type transport system permease protein